MEKKIDKKIISEMFRDYVKWFFIIIGVILYVIYMLFAFASFSQEGINLFNIWCFISYFGFLVYLVYDWIRLDYDERKFKKVYPKMVERDKKIIEWMKKNPKATSEEICNYLKGVVCQ